MEEIKSDIEIAQDAKIQPIENIAKQINIPAEELYFYGPHIAKVNLQDLKKRIDASKPGALVLVSAINPTPAGEGKTTTTIGLADALASLGKKTVCALREPSLGPVFGIKGGACGGGYAQVVPMENINLHFTGDFHAIGAANNLLCAMIDAHIQNGNELNINIKSIPFKRVVDMNDRQLRHIVCGLGGSMNGVPREEGFDITVASEVMAIFCLSTSLSDLKERLGEIVVGYNFQGDPVFAKDLHAQGAMCALLKDALYPNLVQTLEGTPAFVHGGPFANIAHGCNSLIATKAALSLGDYAITEAGFGADLGAEKFLDIKCRLGGLTPDAVVIVATIRALKYHGGVNKENLVKEDVEALKLGFSNLKQHVDNMRDVFGLKCVVAINKFPSDSKNEIECLMNLCSSHSIDVCLSEVFVKGSEGGIELANKIIDIVEDGENKLSEMRFTYELSDSLQEKIEKVAKRIYHARGVIFENQALKSLERLSKMDVDHMPVCIAKTQYSFSDNPKLLGAPKDFDISIRDVKVSAGAGFIVAIAGSIMTMPGLGKTPAACNIDVDDEGKITGLF